MRRAVEVALGMCTSDRSASIWEARRRGSLERERRSVDEERTGRGSVRPHRRTKTQNVQLNIRRSSRRTLSDSLPPPPSLSSLLPPLPPNLLRLPKSNSSPPKGRPAASTALPHRKRNRAEWAQEREVGRFVEERGRASLGRGGRASG